MASTGVKRLRSASITLIISAVSFYLGNRLVEQVIISSKDIASAITESFSNVIPAITNNPFHISLDTEPLVTGGVLFFSIWLFWIRYFAFPGNSRKGEESGSAKWGTKSEGQKFKDTKNPDNNIIFTRNFGMALNRSKFNLELDRNLNVVVVGGSGSGKTRNYVKPNLMQLNSDYFVTDPKGTLLEETGHMFRDMNYRIKSFNTINFDQSLHYNPLAYVKTDADVLSFVNCVIANTSGEGTKGDPFWENAERLLYTALITLLRDWFSEEDYSLSGLLTLLSMAEAREDDEDFMSPLDLIFMQIEEGRKYVSSDGSGEDSTYSWQPSTFRRNYDGLVPAERGGMTADEDFALDNYKSFKVAAGKTLKSILISCNVRLKPLAIREVRELLTYDEMELDKMGDIGRRSIVFGILSDTDKTFSFLFAILMWQAVDQLCRKALNVYGGRLPTPVNFIFDEFANIGAIPEIEEKIAVVRSRNIGITIILQSVAQLESRYEKKAKTIIDCCDTLVFLGGKSNSTNQEIADMIGKETISQVSHNVSTGQQASISRNMQAQGRDLIDAAEIAKMSRTKAIVLIAGANPLMDDKYPVESHSRYKYIDPGHKGALYNEPFSFKNLRRETRGSYM